MILMRHDFELLIQKSFFGPVGLVGKHRAMTWPDTARRNPLHHLSLSFAPITALAKNPGTRNANPGPSEAKLQRRQSVSTVAVVLAFRSLRLSRGVSVAETPANL